MPAAGPGKQGRATAKATLEVFAKNGSSGYSFLKAVASSLKLNIDIHSSMIESKINSAYHIVRACIIAFSGNMRREGEGSTLLLSTQCQALVSNLVGIPAFVARGKNRSMPCSFKRNRLY